MTVWRDGKFLAAGDIGHALDDRGLLLGDGLFETLRVSNGRPVRFERHLARLSASAAELGLTLPDDGMGLERAAGELAHRLGLADAAVRISLTAGSGPRGLVRPDPPGASLFMTAALLAAPPASIRLHESAIRRSPSSPACRHKTLSYVDNVMARREALEAGADMALFLDTDGFLSGCDCANVFWITDFGICTPELDSGVLPGTARAHVLDRLDVVECRALPDVLDTAGMVFVTNALSGAIRVERPGTRDDVSVKGLFDRVRSVLAK